MSLNGSTPQQNPDVTPESGRATLSLVPATRRKGPKRALTANPAMADPLLTVEDVASMLARTGFGITVGVRHPNCLSSAWEMEHYAFEPALLKPSSTSESGCLR